MKSSYNSEILLKFFPEWKKTIPSRTIPLIENLIENSKREDIDQFIEMFKQTGSSWGHFPFSLFSRKIMDVLLEQTVKVNVTGTQNLVNALNTLRSDKADRVVILSNHISYADANIIGEGIKPSLKDFSMENDISVVAGPKVFMNDYRKFASMTFDTFLIAQSLSRATGDAAKISAREVAKAAAKVMHDISQYSKLLFLFPEGSRSRDASMMMYLPGVFRLLDLPGNIFILPCAVEGGENILPVGKSDIREGNVKLHISKPQNLNELKNKFGTTSASRQEIMNFLGKTTAAMLPEKMRGFYS